MSLQALHVKPRESYASSYLQLRELLDTRKVQVEVLGVFCLPTGLSGGAKDFAALWEIRKATVASRFLCAPGSLRGTGLEFYASNGSQDLLG